MSGRNLEDFFEDADGFNALSDEDKARLAAGESIDGETNTVADPGAAVEEGSATPAAATDDPQEVTPPATDPVVLAKDGQHTIPFAELEAARERSRQLEQELAALKSAKPVDPPAAVESQAVAAPAQPVGNEQLATLVEERDNALFAGDTDRAKQLGLQIIGIQNEIATQAAIKHMEDKEAGRKAQESQQSAYELGVQRANELVGKYSFLDPQSPNVSQDAIDLVVAQRDKLIAGGLSFADAIDQAVAKVAPLFDKTTTTKTVATTDAAAKAAEVISKAKAPTPTSLSQVPGGSMAHHDEGEAIRSMSSPGLLNNFMGKSPEQIMELMNKVL